MVIKHQSSCVVSDNPSSILSFHSSFRHNFPARLEKPGGSTDSWGERDSQVPSIYRDRPWSAFFTAIYGAFPPVPFNNYSEKSFFTENYNPPTTNTSKHPLSITLGPTSFPLLLLSKLFLH